MLFGKKEKKKEKRKRKLAHVKINATPLYYTLQCTNTCSVVRRVDAPEKHIEWVRFRFQSQKCQGLCYCSKSAVSLCTLQTFSLFFFLSLLTQRRIGELFFRFCFVSISASYLSGMKCRKGNFLWRQREKNNVKGTKKKSNASLHEETKDTRKNEMGSTKPPSSPLAATHVKRKVTSK
eukprot:gene9244-6497_t